LKFGVILRLLPVMSSLWLFKRMELMWIRMDLSKEFAQIQKVAEKQMKLYSDAKLHRAIDLICNNNPALMKGDLKKTLTDGGLFYTCSEAKCKNPATRRGYCDQHHQKTTYQLMEEEAKKANLKERVNMFLG